ncbi:MAG: hypothetical protein KDE15_00455 [Erythrobacter sp.]|nr:hypothetical protein [Erythrobacter sp.]
MTAQAVPADIAPRPASLPGANSAVWPTVAIGLLLAFQLSMVLTRSINWDEFWFYYHVADFARGNLAQPLQSLHVRLFAWLPGMPGSGVDKIVTARVVMLGCEVATLAAICAIARRFVQPSVALGAALLYLSAGFVLQHGFAFRTDPMATATLMSALAILARARLAALPLLAFALLVAVAGMITMKAVLFAPAFLGLAWLRWSEARFALATALRLAAAGLAAVAIFVALYQWHSAALTQATGGAEMAAGAAGWMFFLGVPPYWQMGVKAVLTAPVLFLLALAAPVITWRSTRPVAEKWALTGLWLPLLLPLFYTNTAAYFYAFMLAPVSVSAALALQAALARYSLRLIVGVLAVMATGVFALEDRAVIHRQRELVEVTEALLPSGTAYFDHNGMIPSLRKANWLVTPAVLDAYRAGGVASYRATMEAEAVPLLLANDEVIEAMLAGDDSVLLPVDAEALRDNYLPFWGPIRLAGYALPAGSDRLREVLVPGSYTVLGGTAVIDGTAHPEGSLVTLSRGTHRIAAPAGAVRLQWGDHLAPPLRPWDDGALYVGF